jgi:hypothetical protein
VYHGVLDYLAIQVLFSCLDDDDDDAPDWLNTAITELLAIAHKCLGENPQQLYRCVWPLAVAALKVRDPIHADWIRGQLNRARVLFSNIGLPMKVIDAPKSPESLFLEYDTSTIVEEVG